MRDSNGNDLDTFPSAMGIITRLACERARQEGVEVGFTCCVKLASRVSRSTTLVLVSPSKVRLRFLELAAKTLKDECLGFHLAQKFDLRMGGLFYYVLASSDTLGEALQRGVRYSAIVNEGITLKLREGKGHRDQFRVCRGCATFRSPSDRVLDGDARSHMPTVDEPSLAGQPSELSPIDAEMIPQSYRTFFGSDVKFGAAVDEVAFPTSIKQIPVVGADPYLNELLIKYCEEALAARSSKRSSFGSNVENVIALHLPHGKARVG